MISNILLINPPIYDFAAYDFWLKPYGMLTAAGMLRNNVHFKLFDYMDRLHSFVAKQKILQSDRWDRGRFYFQKVPIPHPIKSIPRYFRRFGLPRDIFIDFLKKQISFDFVFIQTTMTYWYPGVREVIEDIRKAQPQAKIILGGNYVILCPDHAKKLVVDFLLNCINLEPLWQYLKIKPYIHQPALW